MLCGCSGVHLCVCVQQERGPGRCANTLGGHSLGKLNRAVMISNIRLQQVAPNAPGWVNTLRCSMPDAAAVAVGGWRGLDGGAPCCSRAASRAGSRQSLGMSVKCSAVVAASPRTPQSGLFGRRVVKVDLTTRTGREGPRRVSLMRGPFPICCRVNVSLGPFGQAELAVFFSVELVLPHGV